jgi:Ca2+-binding RTX toxin-like protein
MIKDNRLAGNDGNNIITGSKGNDVIAGGKGEDIPVDYVLRRVY